MGNLFSVESLQGKDKDQIQDFLRERRREVDKSIMKLEDAIAENKGQERALMKKVRLSTKRGDMEAARSAAREIVNLRKSTATIARVNSYLTSANMHIRTMHSITQAAEGLKAATEVMMSVNSTLEPEAIAQTLMYFQMNLTMLENKTFAMDTVMGGALQAEKDAPEIESLVNQVLDEQCMEPGPRAGRPQLSAAELAYVPLAYAEADDSASGSSSSNGRQALES